MHTFTSIWDAAPITAAATFIRCASFFVIYLCLFNLMRYASFFILHLKAFFLSFIFINITSAGREGWWASEREREIQNATRILYHFVYLSFTFCELYNSLGCLNAMRCDIPCIFLFSVLSLLHERA